MVIGGVSVAAVAVGLALAGVFEHAAWRLADECRRRRARRRNGYVNAGRPVR